ncbi:MAG: DNA-binding response regulator [Flavobacteriaceae bacterium]|nr:DNA-binding response regulator [Flavobacteriaceae bacterium]
MPSHKIKTIIIDDELRAINRLKLLLEHFPEIKIVKEITKPFSNVSLVINSHPDLVFLDVEMPGKTGIEIAEEMNHFAQNIKIVFVTSHDHYAIKAIKNNVFDYLLKPVSIEELKQCIGRFKVKTQSLLTAREIQIISAVAQGHNSAKIGTLLNISRHTVDTHRRTILEKTHTKNTAELITYAVKGKLV